MSKSTKIIAALGVIAGLGVAAMPLSSYADTEKNTNLSLKIAEILSIEATPAVDLDEVTDNTNGSISTKTGTVTVKTNSRGGYKVNIAGVGATDRHLDKDNNGDRKTGLVDEFGDIIPSLTAQGPLSQTTSAWGYRIDGVVSTNNSATTAATNGTDYIGVTKDGAQAFEESKATDTNGNVYTIKYGVAAQSDQPAGTYKGAVKYTVTATAGTAEV